MEAEEGEGAVAVEAMVEYDGAKRKEREWIVRKTSLSLAKRSDRGWARGILLGRFLGSRARGIGGGLKLKSGGGAKRIQEGVDCGICRVPEEKRTL